MHSLWRVGLVSALLAAGVAFGPAAVRADVVEIGEERQASEVYSDMCGLWEDDTPGERTFVYACGSRYPDGGQVKAERVVCTTVGNRTDCVGTVVKRPGRPGEVSYDPETRVGRIVATIDGCVIDVTLRGDRAYGSRSSTLPAPSVRQGRLELTSRNSSSGSQFGTAEGEVCAWAEAAGVGEGRVYYGQSEDVTTYAEPDYSALSPVASVSFSRRTREQGRQACGEWIGGGGALIRACGVIYASGARWLSANRSSCVGSGCTYVAYSEQVGHDEVMIDLDSGNSTLAGELEGCGRVDLALSTPSSRYYEGSPAAPYADGSVPGTVSISRPTSYSTYGYDGEATGTVCDWVESTVPGEALKSSWGYVDDVTTIDPALPA